MKTDYVLVYAFLGGDVVRVASCRFIIDAIMLYYFNEFSAYIVFRGKKLKEPAIARIAFENLEYLKKHFDGSPLLSRVTDSIARIVD